MSTIDAPSPYASAGYYEPQTYYICWIIGGSDNTESEGQKVLGPSMIVRRQMATLWEL